MPVPAVTKTGAKKRLLLAKTAAVLALSGSLVGATAGIASAKPDIGNGCDARWRTYNTSMYMFYQYIDAGDFKEAAWWHDAAERTMSHIVMAGCV